MSSTTIRNSTGFITVAPHDEGASVLISSGGPGTLSHTALSPAEARALAASLLISADAIESPAPAPKAAPTAPARSASPSSFPKGR